MNTHRLSVPITFLLLQVFLYDPQRAVLEQHDMRLNRQLMRRYYLVQEAKDAEVIGIVVGTLDVGMSITLFGI